MMREELTNDPEEAARTALEGLQARVWTTLPGIIETVGDGELSVRPAIQGRITELNPTTGELTTKFVELPLLIHVPIVWPQCGDFALTFPLKKGHEVLVEFSARAIDSWYQSGGVGVPVEDRMHDLSDGFAHVGIRSQANKIPNVSAEAVQLRNNDGTSFVEINDAGDVNIVSPGKVTVKAGGDVTVESVGEVSIKALKITLDAPVIAFRAAAGMIDLGLHLHGGGSPPTLPIIPPV